MRGKWLKTGIVAAVASALTLPILALGGDRHGHHGRKGFGPLIERHAEELGIDADTRERIEAIGEQTRARTRDLREALRSERVVLKELLGQDAPNESAILSQVDVLGQLRTSIHKEKLRGMLQVRALLTPEQVQRLQELRQERRERFKEHRKSKWGKWRGGPGRHGGPEQHEPVEG